MGWCPAEAEACGQSLPHTTHTGGMQGLQLRIANGFVQHGDATGLRTKSRQRIQHGAVVTTVGRRRDEHHALRAGAALQKAVVSRAGIGRRQTRTSNRRIRRVVHMDMGVAGSVRHLDLRAARACRKGRGELLRHKHGHSLSPRGHWRI